FARIPGYRGYLSVALWANNTLAVHCVAGPTGPLAMLNVRRLGPCAPLRSSVPRVVAPAALVVVATRVRAVLVSAMLNPPESIALTEWSNWNAQIPDCGEGSIKGRISVFHHCHYSF
ncbi:MAG: hypothetical protein ABJA60_05450, partial [Nitrosospira sp.]